MVGSCYRLPAIKQLSSRMTERKSVSLQKQLCFCMRLTPSDDHWDATSYKELELDLDKQPQRLVGGEQQPQQENVHGESNKSRSQKIKSLWRDPAFRARNLAARRASDVLSKQSVAVKSRWKDPNYRNKVISALKGRIAWNRGKTLSLETRERMSIAAKKRHQRRKQHSQFAGVFHQSDSQHCSELQNHFQKQLFCLYSDLKLWSDNFRAIYTRLPRMSDVERSVAPVLLFKVKRYLELRNILQSEPYHAQLHGMVILKEDEGNKKKYTKLDSNGNEEYRDEG
eukprot:jgi/Galph1/3178/GphlegSOOS_G1873.1